MGPLKTKVVTKQERETRAHGLERAKDDQCVENALQSTPALSMPQEYPPVWKNAFILGNNVRFTRTPEVEIIRRRLILDHEVAKKTTSAGRAETAKRNTRQVSDTATVRNYRAPGPMTTPTKNTQLTVQDPKIREEQSARNDRSVVLSDAAFFEFFPFLPFDDNLDYWAKDLPPGQQSANPYPSEDQPHHASISELFRVLEYRYPLSTRTHKEMVTQGDKPLEWGIDSNRDHVETATSEDSKEQRKIAAAPNKKFRTEITSSSNREQPLEQNKTVAEGTERATKFGADEQQGDIAAQFSIEAGEGLVAPRPLPHAPYQIAPQLDATTRVNYAKCADSVLEEKAASRPHSIEIIPHGYDRAAKVPNISGGIDDKPDNGAISYQIPSVNLLQEAGLHSDLHVSEETLQKSAGLLESVLEDFGIKGEIIHVRPGPVVTLYEFEPAPGVKSSRIIGISDDIARSMSAVSARVAVIPGRNVIGIELPNQVRETVYLRELIQTTAFRESNFELPLALGKNIGGEPVIAELAKMPHLLVAGTTGSGKSVAINAMILSLLYKMTPDQCRLIMVDPKMLELSIYDGIPHLLTPVVTDPKKAVTALKWAVREMEARYRKMAKLGVRNIDGFNQRISAALAKGEVIECTVQAGFDKETGELLYQQEVMERTKLPYIVVIVDEMADLMMVAGKEIECAIQRLAQMARAAGIHLIMATQRPSVDVITGTIKANFPTRISFQVTSKIDSRTILGEQGAETLLGQGDMLHMVGGGRIIRVHGPFVSDHEVEQVVAHLKTQGVPDYLANVTDSADDDTVLEQAESVAEILANGNGPEDSEELYLQAVKIVMRDRKCSTSYIQRRLSIGYNKAASLVERMEAEGIVGAANHIGKRDILVNARG